MKLSTLYLFTIATSFLLGGQISNAQIIGNAGGGWSLRGSDPIQLFYGDELITVYNAGEQEGKPFFYPIMGPTGENMTRHWPMKDGVEGEAQDHIHHRGMWYGLGKVNGFDFWHFHGDDSKKDRQFGVIKHRGMNGFASAGGKVTFRTKSDWLAHADQKKVCSDTREFSLFYREDGALVVDATITLIADAGDVNIVDDKEGAWSIRVIPTLRLEGEVAKGSMVNSEGVTGKDVWGKRANWVDYYGPDKAGNQVGVAMFDHPSNPRYPTWWHARHYGLFTANPFGQGNFEKGAPEDAGNYTIKEGDSLTFRYRTIFHKGDHEAAKIADSYKEFAGE